MALAQARASHLPSAIKLNHYFAKLLSRLKPLKGSTSIFQGIDRIHKWSQMALAQEAHYLTVLGVTSHRGAHDRPLIPEHPTDVRHGVWSCRSTTSHQSTLLGKQAKRTFPSRLTDILHYHIHPSLTCKSSYFLDNVVRGVIESEIGAHLRR